ncbi:unnamed protein product [Chrysoparadoxa australica]
MAALLEGTAKLVRAVTADESGEEFDLGGYTEPRVQRLVQDAFSTPLPATRPLRLSFLMGGGKNDRQRFDSNLGKWLAAALREVGYTEDRGASEIEACMGTFRTQHDLGKNLIYMYVFPVVELKDEQQGDSSSGETGSDAAAGGASIEFLCASCELETLKLVVKEKAQSWNQKKKCKTALEEMGKRFQAAEAKMVSMQELTAEEQELYDSTSTELIVEKLQWLNGEIKSMVDKGLLTKDEKQQLMASTESRIEKLWSELKGAEEAAQPKAVARLTKQLEGAKSRLEAVSGIDPITHSLKHQQAIRDLVIKLVPLEKLEHTKGRLLTQAELKAVGEKPQLEEELDALEQDSRGWFEEEELFQARLATVKSNATKAASRKTAPKMTGPSKVDHYDSIWQTAGKKGKKR